MNHIHLWHYRSFNQLNTTTYEQSVWYFVPSVCWPYLPSSDQWPRWLWCTLSSACIGVSVPKVRVASSWGGTMNLNKIRTLCSIDRQIKVKLGKANLDPKKKVISYADVWQRQPEGRSDTALTAHQHYSRFQTCRAIISWIWPLQPLQPLWHPSVSKRGQLRRRNIAASRCSWPDAWLDGRWII